MEEFGSAESLSEENGVRVAKNGWRKKNGVSEVVILLVLFSSSVYAQLQIRYSL